MLLSTLRTKSAVVAAASLLGAAIFAQAAPLEVVSYRYSKEPNPSYPDPELTKLTDGEIVADQDAPPYDRSAAVGWLLNPVDTESPHPAIVFDLGEVKYVDEIAINYVLWPGAGVRAPEEVRVSYSRDGEFFMFEEAFTGFDGTDNDPYVYFTRSLLVDAGGQAARFVRLDFRQGTEGTNRSLHHFLDEISFDGREIDDWKSDAAAAIHQAVELEFETEPGVVYQIQSSPDLVNWEPFGPKILGDGEIYLVFSSAKNDDRAFFRVRTNQ